MNRKSIWLEAQNRPTLIVRDLAPYAPADVVYETLLRRGVFKWLAARRKVIRLKNTWRVRITASLAEQREADPARKQWLRGYRAGIEQCRAELRAICHGERWDCPDFDREAQRWLERYERENAEDAA